MTPKAGTTSLQHKVGWLGTLQLALVFLCSFSFSSTCSIFSAAIVLHTCRIVGVWRIAYRVWCDQCVSWAGPAFFILVSSCNNERGIRTYFLYLRYSGECNVQTSGPYTTGHPGQISQVLRSNL